MVISPKNEMIYAHVLNRGGRGVDSPADRLRLRVAGRDILWADSRIDCRIRSISRLGERNDRMPKEAVEDWRYWVRRGYQF